MERMTRYRPSLAVIIVPFVLSILVVPTFASDAPLMREQWRADLRKNSVSAQHAAEALLQAGESACREAIPDLVNALQFDEESVAQAVSPALLKAGPASILFLERSLSNSNFFVRRRAAQILGQFGPAAKRASAELAQRLLDPKVEVQAAAEKALVAIGQEAVPAVSDMLRRVDEPTRKPILRVLSEFGSAGVAPILERLKNDESPYIRTVAAEALAQSKAGTGTVIRGLILATSDLDEGVRGAAVDALGTLGESAQPALGRLIVMAHEDKDGLVRQKASEALPRLGKLTNESLPGIVNALHSSNPACREEAITRLSNSTMTVAEAGSALSAAMKDDEVGVRVQAVKTASLLSKQTLEALPLFRAALADTQPQVRSAAIQALANRESSPEAAGALESILKDPNPALRREAIQALGSLGVSAIPSLIVALGDPYSLLADEAASAIQKIGKDALPALESAEATAQGAVKSRIADLVRRVRRQPLKRK